jgi:tRNA (cytidine/uridine-2'-O-)-methyltransferase
MRPALALIEPEIAGNVGALLRTASCLGVEVHIVEPCGFAFSDRSLKRAGMDYIDAAIIVRHGDRAAFMADMAATGRRLVLMTTDGDARIDRFAFSCADVLMLGSESKGAPADIHAAAAARLRIPLMPTARSFNISVAGGIAIAEALRQTGGFPA